jgi:hypothetical protein
MNFGMMGVTAGSILEQPPSTSQPTCPDGSSLDASSKSAPVIRGPNEPRPTDQGTQSTSAHHNKPSRPKLQKRDIIELQPTD